MNWFSYKFKIPLKTENDSSLGSFYFLKEEQQKKEDLEQKVMCSQECFNYIAYSYDFKKSKQTYVSCYSLCQNL